MEHTDPKKLSVIRRYPMEFLVSICIVVSGFLYVDGRAEREEMKRYLYEDRANMKITLDNSTRAIENMNRLMEQMQRRGQ